MALLVALPILVALNFVLVRGVRFCVLASSGVAEARLFGREAPFTISRWARSKAALATFLVGYVIAASIAAAGFMCVGETRSTTRVVPVAGGAAESAGIVGGDRILRVNDKPVATFDELAQSVRSHAGEDVDVTIERAGLESKVRVKVGAEGTPHAGKIGVTGIPEYVAASPLYAMGTALSLPVAGVKGVMEIISPAPKADLVGPVGIVKSTAAAPSPGPVAWVGVMLVYIGWWQYLALLIAPFVAFVTMRGRERKGATGVHEGE